MNAVNDPPVAVDDNYTTLQNTMLTETAPGVLGNDNDPEGDALTANLASDVASGTLSLNTNGSFTYMPNVAFTGVDSFTYVANDGLVDSNPTTVMITVQAGSNQPPVAVDDSATTAEETPVTVDVLANDSDPDGDALTVVAVGVPADGTAMDNSDGTVTYTPNSNFTGIDSFTYTIEDGQGGSSSATVTLTVTPVNDPPVANGDTYSTPQNTMLTVAAPGVLVNDIDPDGDVLAANLISGVANGTLFLGSNGSFDYTPNPGFTGTDSFTYVATDGLVDSNEATVTITVQTLAAIEAEITVPSTINGAKRGKSPVQIEVEVEVELDDMQVVIASLDCGGDLSNAMAIPGRIAAKDDDENEFVALFNTQELRLTCEDTAIVCTGTLADGTTFSGMDKTSVIRDFEGERCDNKKVRRR